MSNLQTVTAETITVAAFTRNGRVVNSHVRRSRRHKISDPVQVTLYLPGDVYDRCCREALRRDVPLAQVLRENISRWKPVSTDT
jgi:hypothetical protein